MECVTIRTVASIRSRKLISSSEICSRVMASSEPSGSSISSSSGFWIRARAMATR